MQYPSDLYIAGKETKTKTITVNTRMQYPVVVCVFIRRAILYVEKRGNSLFQDYH
jgi:hypothetical protein